MLGCRRTMAPLPSHRNVALVSISHSSQSCSSYSYRGNLSGDMYMKLITIVVVHNHDDKLADPLSSDT